MRPVVVSIGNATLYLGDCRQILPTLPKVDAIVSDPPYGIDFVQRTTGETITGDDTAFEPDFMWDMADRFFLWGANHYHHALPQTGQWHVWVKRAVEIAAPKSYSDCEFAWCSHSTSSKAIRLISDGCIRQGIEFGIKRVHPSQKPQEVMEWSLSLCGGESIADPFMGSGSTGVACMGLGKPFVGIEIERKYFDIACQRIEQAQRQGRLFA